MNEKILKYIKNYYRIYRIVLVMKDAMLYRLFIQLWVTRIKNLSKYKKKIAKA